MWHVQLTYDMSNENHAILIIWSNMTLLIN
jgi:hypothetical protein